MAAKLTDLAEFMERLGIKSQSI